MKLIETEGEGPLMLEVNVVPSRMGQGVWIVESIDLSGDGLVLQTHFQPPFAERRARDYAVFLRGGRVRPGEALGEAALADASERSEESSPPSSEREDSRAEQLPFQIKDGEG